ncbi:MAG: sigma 54-dependent Fis family transcriptional regulator [Kofleriaceae bacterium]|nr:sigma 54-dependent Fis family transcriptional regulator [Kofleriaceae bacterium]MBP9170099.1 sigma 54-dependent Fis family transcriptional regulator [Kofleriaceae bacterium]MBP9859949.1 sigma 54-dependent Fis family transcriptional regulator [Kofleriaceae bacterium]
MTDNLESPTWVTSHQGSLPGLSVRRCRLDVTSGPDAGLAMEFAQPTILIGRTGADLTLTDPKVSGLHCELRLTPEGYRLRDLESTNGTHVRGVRVVEGYIQPGSTIGVGKSAITFTPLADAVALPLWTEPRLCGLIGGSPAMRHLFELIERFARSDATVLIQAETGTGKELVADAIHQRSPRARGPFQVLDCSAIPEQLFEDQIFGHEQGSFTGAGKATMGVFEAAHGGTLFLDEIGELPLDVQSKLLRAVETRRIRRIGSTKAIQCDVRIVAATNRDLAVEVNRGTFRSDLFYRLAVAKLTIPPLRERKEDLPLLVSYFLRQLEGVELAALPQDFMDRAARHAWPGNVRELRNAVERAALLPHHPALQVEPQSVAQHGGDWATIDVTTPFKVAKQKLVDEFDRRYLETLLELHDGNISAAARAAGIDRMSIYKMMRRLGLSDEAPAEE